MGDNEAGLPKYEGRLDRLLRARAGQRPSNIDDPVSDMAITLKHPELGQVIGTRHGSEDVVQYLGIHYATLAHRFAPPAVKKDYGGKVDAKAFGPSVVTSPIGCDIEFGLIQKSLEKPPLPSISDVEGLNLNITVPAEVPDSAEACLPVICFVHGGGFLFGGTWAPHYDLAAFVAFSVSIGKPVVGVSINYRLGVPGFLDSDELRASGAPPNRGILDQGAAFQWLRQNIAGFGGDPDQVTAIGQSAGGSSIMHMLNLEQVNAPPFDRAVCLSGNLMAASVFSRSVAQAAYRTVIECLGIDSRLSVEEQVRLLTATASDELLAKVPPSVPLGPVVDDDQLPSFQAMHAKPPVRHSVPLMSGSTDLDGAIFEVLGIFAGRDESSLVEDFTNVLRRFVPLDQHPSIAKILSLYGVSSTPGHAPGQVQLSILQFGTDLKYFASTQGYALSWPSKSWTYYFQEPNPWEGPHQGHSAHCLDIAYLFLNYKHLMSESQLEVAHTFARDVLSFVYGDAPWPEFRCSRKMRVYGKSQNSLLEQEIAEEGSAGPSSAIRKLWDEIGLDKLVDAWDAYLARR